MLTRDAPVTVVLPTAARLRPHPRLRVVRSPLAARDRTLVGGLPVTTPLRTAFDLGRHGTRVEALVAVDALLHRRLVRLPGLRDFAAARAGWPGLSLLREVLALAEPLSESPMETRMRLLCSTPASARSPLDSARRRAFRGPVDLAWPALRLAVEYDGDHHRERAHFRRDVARLERAPRGRVGGAAVHRRRRATPPRRHSRPGAPGPGRTPRHRSKPLIRARTPPATRRAARPAVPPAARHPPPATRHPPPATRHPPGSPETPRASVDTHGVPLAAESGDEWNAMGVQGPLTPMAFHSRGSADDGWNAMGASACGQAQADAGPTHEPRRRAGGADARVHA
ncbi:hypothetical protein V2I01_08795 [Micromonospora sp. BRA006-A]|nr:hypothetical protein [Micromonospora sp. BRA006-A]